MRPWIERSGRDKERLRTNDPCYQKQEGGETYVRFDVMGIKSMVEGNAIKYVKGAF